MSWYRAPLWDWRPDITSCRVLLSEIWEGQSYLTTRSVSQYVLVSSTLVGLATRYYFLSECCCLKFKKVEGRSYFTSDDQSVCLGTEDPCGTCDQILLPAGMLLSEICGLVSIGRPLWREDGSAICSVITQWSKSRRTRTNTLLSHLRLPQPGGLGSHIYIPKEQGGLVIPQGTGFPFCRLLRLTGLWWRYSNPPRIYVLQEQDGPVQSQSQSQSHIMTDDQSISMSRCLVHSAVKGFHPNGFQSEISRRTLRRKCWCYDLECQDIENLFMSL
jgi:hypothetical protein